MAIIFDCDGVLVDSERLVCRIEAELLSAWGWACTPEELRTEFKGCAFPDMARIIERRLAGRLPVDWMYLWAMETANGFRVSLREVRGVRSVLELLSATRQPVCVASQSPLPRVRLSLGVCDLARYFGPHVFTASMVARPKPAPDLFLHAAAQLGVAPERCTVIEDSPSGVRAAVAAGMRVLGYAGDEDAARLAAAGAQAFSDMAELPQLIQMQR
jgi:beta-phosphoglucomutase-like phosphatase (HAD superfamily)